MKTTCALLSAVGLIIGTSIVQANSVTKESFYRSCIEQEIKNCESKVNFVNSKGKHIKRDAEIANEKAKFYQEHKEALVQEMMRQNLDAKSYKVDYFLIKSYNNRPR